MKSLEKDIQFYETLAENLENGKWVLIYKQELISTFDTFEKAAEFAVRRFGAGPYLIRQAGAHSLVLPASVVFRMNPNA